MVPPTAPPLAVLQAAINAAADLSPRFACAFDVASERVKDGKLFTRSGGRQCSDRRALCWRTPNKRSALAAVRQTPRSYPDQAPLQSLCALLRPCRTSGPCKGCFAPSRRAFGLRASLASNHWKGAELMRRFRLVQSRILAGAVGVCSNRGGRAVGTLCPGTGSASFFRAVP